MYPRSKNNGGSLVDRQTSLERHQSIASVSSMDTVATLGRLLDRLEFDEDLPWATDEPRIEENVAEYLHIQRQPSGAGLNYAKQQRQLLMKSSFINNGRGGPMRFNSLRNSMRSSQDDSVFSAAKTAEALGSTVSQVQNPVVVGHANINQKAYAQATLEMNEEEDLQDDDDDAQTIHTKQTPPSLVNSRSSLDVAVKREDPNEVRVKKAVQLQKEGKPREAAYELSIAAHHGSRTAMLLYGIFLRIGNGLKKDAKQSFLWIARAATYDLILNANSDYSVDPNKLTEDGIPKPAPEPDARAFYELGIAFLNGIGTEKDENRALQFFEKSASLGYVEAMTQAGMLWYKKGPHGRKKDLNRSAAWLRFADKRGADNVGTSWIYKDKYMKKK